MTEKFEISKYDIKGNQIFLWIITFVSVIPFTIALFFNVSLSNFVFTAIVYTLNFFIQRQNAKLWNVWYENGEIILENIYQKKVKPVENFEKTVMTGVFFNQYNIYFRDNDNSQYYFRIKTTENMALLFKNDDQFYAKRINAKLQEIKDLIG